MGNALPNPKYGYLYPLRPDGEICIIEDIEYSNLNIYGIIIITGKERGKHKYVRRREIVIARGRKPEIEDIKENTPGRYQIGELSNLFNQN